MSSCGSWPISPLWLLFFEPCFSCFFALRGSVAARVEAFPPAANRREDGVVETSNRWAEGLACGTSCFRPMNRESTPVAANLCPLFDHLWKDRLAEVFAFTGFPAGRWCFQGLRGCGFFLSPCADLVAGPYLIFHPLGFESSKSWSPEFLHSGTGSVSWTDESSRHGLIELNSYGR